LHNAFFYSSGIYLIRVTMAYIPRIIEADLSGELPASGAVLIKAPKSCGKTETAKQFAKI
jgi:hypothetical protein